MAHYFEVHPTSKSSRKTIKVFINDEPFTFVTDNDVFSKNGLDFGTRTLLESLDLNKIDGHILDFGCGYGPIGIYLAKHHKQVDMLDINERALSLACDNALQNGVDVTIFASDIYDKVTQKYDYIITNPPIRVGKTILLKILFEAQNYLVPNGHLIFVVHKDQGAKTLVKLMAEKYEVNVINKSKGFYVIDCQNY